MKTKIYQEWNFPKILNNIVNDIKNLDYDLYIIVQPQEPYYHDKNFYIINDALKDKSKKLIIYIGSEVTDELSTMYSEIEFIYWNSIDYASKSYVFHTIIDDLPSEQVRFYNYLKDFNPIKHFTTLVKLKKYKLWRLFLINEIYKNDLYSYGNYSVRIEDDEKNNVDDKINYYYFDYPFNYKDIQYFEMTNWTPINSTFSDIITNPTCDIQKILHPKYFISDIFYMICSNSDFEYMICAFDIVMETVYDCFCITEKTLRPIDAKKPFMVFSSFNFHKKLRDKYGFKLFDNIIDYSFDNEENTTTRWDMQMKELVKLKDNYTPQEIKDLTLNDVNHNYSILENLRKTHAKNIPEEYIKYKIENEYCNYLILKN